MQKWTASRRAARRHAALALENRRLDLQEPPTDTRLGNSSTEAGCRGFTVGGAQVSEKHTNFLINTGDATSADIEALGEEVRRRVKDKSGIELQWEIQRVGMFAGAPKNSA